MAKEQIKITIHDNYSQHFARMGFKNGEKISFYVKYYYELILSSVPEIERKDFLFLCNKLGQMYKACEPCINNFRVCISNEAGAQTIEYKEAIKQGCCGFYDELIKNHITEHWFYIGCNFGH